MKKKTAIALLAGGITVLGAQLAYAAPADGPGPWADQVIKVQQGVRTDGSAIPSDRTDPSNAVGVAENTNASGTFFSLGFDNPATPNVNEKGELKLGFDAPAICDGPGADIEIVEATLQPYPTEKVDVYVGTSSSGPWTLIQAGAPAGVDPGPETQVDLAGSGVTTASWVRLVEASNPADFAGHNPPGDGYDVDGVRALNPCQSTGTAELSGKINLNGTGGQPGSHSFATPVAIDGAGAGQIDINYKLLKKTCSFTQGAGSTVLDGGTGIATLTGWTNSCGGTANITLYDRDKFPQRGKIMLDASNNTYDILEGGSGPATLVTGNVHVA